MAKKDKWGNDIPDENSGNMDYMTVQKMNADMAQAGATRDHGFEINKLTKATELAKPLTDAKIQEIGSVVKHNNSLTDQQVAQTGIYKQFEAPKQQLLQDDMRNTVGLNKEFGHALKSASVRVANADAGYMEGKTEDIAKERQSKQLTEKLATVLPGQQLQTQDRHLKDTKTYKRKVVENFSPFAPGTSGSDNSSFIDAGRQELGMEPRSYIARVLNRTIPFSAPIQANRIKEKLLAKP